MLYKFTMVQVRIDLAIKKEEASKFGIIIQDVSEGDKGDTVENTVGDIEKQAREEAERLVEDIEGIDKSFPSPAKRTRK